MPLSNLRPQTWFWVYNKLPESSQWWVACLRQCLVFSHWVLLLWLSVDAGLKHLKTKWVWLSQTQSVSPSLSFSLPTFPLSIPFSSSPSPSLPPSLSPCASVCPCPCMCDAYVWESGLRFLVSCLCLSVSHCVSLSLSLSVQYQYLLVGGADFFKFCLRFKITSFFF